MATVIPKTTAAILSIGDMGSGVARLLVAKGFRVVTDVTGRSADTILRAQQSGVESLSLSAIVAEASAILSIVPPADAKSTAQAVLSAIGSGSARSEPLVYVDLNAISPASAREIASLFSSSPHSKSVTFVDGAIIGGPPSLSKESKEDWSVPQIPTSGTSPLPAALASALESYHISPDIGSASGLKMCFASLTKGYTAIAIQAFTTAQRLGVLKELQDAVDKTIPGMKTRIEKGVTGMPPKAYRWVREMEEIADTHREDGGLGLWGPSEEGKVGAGADMFTGAARTYELVAHGTVLGQEKIGKRSRGTTVEDVARAVAEGLGELEGEGKRMRRKIEEADGGGGKEEA